MPHQESSARACGGSPRRIGSFQRSDCVSSPDRSRMMAELAPHVADALQLSLHFGLRKKEALTIEVGNVDFGMNDIWLRGERTKNGADEFIPGNGPAMALLR